MRTGRKAHAPDARAVREAQRNGRAPDGLPAWYDATPPTPKKPGRSEAARRAR